MPIPPAQTASVPALSSISPSGAKPAGEVVDVLADVDKMSAPAPVRQPMSATMSAPVNPPALSPMAPQSMPMPSAVGGGATGFAGLWQNKKWLVIGGAVVILAIIALGVSAYLGTFSGGTANTNQQTTNNQPTDQGVSQQPTTPPAVEPLSTPETGLPGDDDRDGLTNAEEAKLGTNPEVADTDGDGLSDYEEVKIYHTDPLKADTDGDGFKDGDEVKNGYNPLGSGKLLDIDAALKQQQSTSGNQPTTATTASPTAGLPISGQ